MTIDLAVLRHARDALAQDLGSLDDLREETRNTLSNIYYKFHLVIRGPDAALNIEDGDVMSRYSQFMLGMGQITSEYKFAARLVESMREVRAEKPELFDFLETNFLDTFKYRIVDAHEKTAIRRAIERPFCKIDEIPDLYDQMQGLK